MTVSAARRMLRAISFGVFWRLAPSTIAIIRSRNVSPGLAVIRMTNQSDRTRVPPVTALRSPLSRMTGALSPVMALSFTDAIPWMTSPSQGIKSSASTNTTSPRFKALAGTREDGTSRYWSPDSGLPNFFAFISRRELRNDSACAFPRPSANASEKFANSTVNQSHRDTARMNQTGASPFPNSAWKNRTVVSTLPTATTNMTGLRIWYRG